MGGTVDVMTTRRRAVLNEDQVKEIKYQLNLGTKQKNLAARYGVTFATINAIKMGKSWRDVEA